MYPVHPRSLARGSLKIADPLISERPNSFVKMIFVKPDYLGNNGRTLTYLNRVASDNLRNYVWCLQTILEYKLQPVNIF